MYGANWCVGEQISTVEDLMGVKRCIYSIGVKYYEMK